MHLDVPAHYEITAVAHRIGGHGVLTGHLHIRDNRPFIGTISYFDELFREAATTYMVHAGDIAVDPLPKWYSQSRYSRMGALLQDLQPNELADICNNYDALINPILLRLHLAHKGHTPPICQSLDGLLLLKQYREQIADDKPSHFYIYEHLEQLPLRRQGQHASEQDARRILQAYEKHDGIVSRASKRLKMTPQTVKEAWIYAGLFPKNERTLNDDECATIVDAYHSSGGVVRRAARQINHTDATVRRVWKSRGLQPVDGRSRQARRWRSRNA